jgi:hypothetical protein
MRREANVRLGRENASRINKRRIGRRLYWGLYVEIEGAFYGVYTGFEFRFEGQMLSVRYRRQNHQFMIIK